MTSLQNRCTTPRRTCGGCSRNWLGCLAHTCRRGAAARARVPTCARTDGSEPEERHFRLRRGGLDRVRSTLSTAAKRRAEPENRLHFLAAKNPRGTDDGRVAQSVIAAARAYLPPELYNRIDEVVCMAALSREDVAEIARRLLAGLGATLGRRGIALEVAEGVVDVLLQSGGFDPELGARPLKRTIGRLIENPLAELILRGDLEDGGTVLVEVEGGEIVVDAVCGARTQALR